MKLLRSVFLYGAGLTPLAILALSACGSFDFGEAPVDLVSVNAESPSWEADIEPVVQMKCMNCHAESRSSFVPTDTPPYAQNKFDKKDIFKSKAVTIQRRIFEDKTKPMPPHFATPLTAEESLALKNYIKTLTAAPTGPSPSPQGSPSPDAVKFAAVQELYSKSCAQGNCHASGKQGPDLSNYSKLKTMSARAKSRLADTAAPMPPKPDYPNPHYQPTAEERQLMIKWVDDGAVE